MNGERAGIFDTEDEFDVSGFAPKGAAPASRQAGAGARRVRGRQFSKS